MPRIKYRPFVPYQDAFDEFAKLRKEVNRAADEGEEEFKDVFSQVKVAAAEENTVAMDILAYYYKTGVENMLPENYERYINWQLLAAARGNQFAIEKLQFLIGFACDQIIEHEDFDLIAYKNDIEQSNLLYVLGKAIAKIYVKEFGIYAVDLFESEDEYQPYKKENSINLRRNIEKIIPKTINYLKS